MSNEHEKTPTESQPKQPATGQSAEETQPDPSKAPAEGEEFGQTEPPSPGGPSPTKPK